MSQNQGCIIVSRDGDRHVADRRMLSDSSPYFRNILNGLNHLEEPVIRLDNLDSKVLELVLKIIKGEVCIDVWAPENHSVLDAAVLLGIIPPMVGGHQDLGPPVDLILDQV